MPRPTPINKTGIAVRAIEANWMALLVLVSYAWTRFVSRFRSPRSQRALWERVHARNARRIRRAVLSLQGLFIKIGQLLSILANALPEAFRKGLEDLQDRVPPHPFHEIEDRIQSELGRKASEIFESIDPVPLAAASIGQVHRARLADGRQVAVKIQYPGIERLVHSDLRLLHRIFGWLDRFLPEHGWPTMYREIRSMVLAELDFRQEARHLQDIASNLQGFPGVAFPDVIDDLTTQRVLTTSFEPGVRISDLPAIDQAGIDRKELATLVVRSYCEQIFVHGIYHADPHPGNILARKDEQGRTEIVFLDFGAVSRVSEDMRSGMAALVLGALANDTAKVIEAMRTMGFIAKDADPAIYHRIISFFHRKLHDEVSLESLHLEDIKIDPSKGFESLADLKGMDITVQELASQFRIPKEWILFERTLLLLTGLCTELAPDMNPTDILMPYLRRFVLGDRDPTTLVMDAAKDVFLSAVSLPGELRNSLSLLEQGKLQVQFGNLTSLVQAMNRLGRQALLTALGIASGAFSFAFHDRGMVTESHWAMGISALLLTWVLLSLLRGAPRDR